MPNEVARIGVEHALWLMIVILAVAIITKYVKLPYTIALVVTGLIIALLPQNLATELQVPLTSDLILFIFLPPLLFEGAYNLNFRHLRHDLGSVTVLAIFGVLATVGLVGVAVHYLVGLDWAVAFLFGAIVAATDPIAVIATFRQLGTPTRLNTIVEGESLFNDGTSLVIFSIILSFFSTGSLSVVDGVGQFLQLTVGGLVVGVLIGALYPLLMRRVDDHLVETVFTIVIAYGTYIIAEGFHVSGVIAVVAAGLMVGNVGGRVAMSFSTRIAVNYTWDLLGFVANSLIFILIGVQLNVDLFARYFWPILVAALATLLSRALAVYVLHWLLIRPLGRPIPTRWLAVITWGGLRGALALAAALSIPVGLLPEGLHEELLVMAYGVILFTMLGQGLSMGLVVRLMGLGVQATVRQLDHERTAARLQTSLAAHQALQRLLDNGQVHEQVAQPLLTEYSARERALRSQLSELEARDEGQLAREQATTRRQLMEVETTALQTLFQQGKVSSEVQRQLLSDIDQRLHDAEQIASGSILLMTPALAEPPEQEGKTGVERAEL